MEEKLNSEINTIKDQMEIYTIISSYPDSSLNKKYSELIINLTRLNSQYGDLKLKINSLIKEADEMYQNQNNFESVISKLNEALLYDPSSVLVISKRNDYLSKWILKLTTELNASIINKDFKTSLEISEKLILIDRNNESVYKQNQNNLINSYFKESINKIKSLLRNGSVKESFKLLNDITKYSYVNYDEFKAVKLELESSIIDDAIRTINNKIYESKPDEALTICTEILKEYPDNKSLKDLQNKILDNISANEKKGLLETRSTHYIVELNYSFSKFPETFSFNSTSAQPSAQDIFNIDLNNAISNYQFGLYRKINIKDRLSNSSKKHKFSYSQIGIRASYLNTSTYNFQSVSSTGNSIFLFKVVGVEKEVLAVAVAAEVVLVKAAIERVGSNVSE